MALLSFLIFSLQFAQESISFVFSGNQFLLFKVFLFFCISSVIFIISFPLLRAAFPFYFVFFFLFCAVLTWGLKHVKQVLYGELQPQVCFTFLRFTRKFFEIPFLLQGGICTLALTAVFLFSLESSCFLRFGAFVLFSFADCLTMKPRLALSV